METARIKMTDPIDHQTDPAQGSEDRSTGQQIEHPAAVQRELTPEQKMALQIGVGRKMFAPDCLFYARAPADITLQPGGRQVETIYLGEGKSLYCNVPMN